MCLLVVEEGWGTDEGFENIPKPIIVGFLFGDFGIDVLEVGDVGLAMGTIEDEVFHDSACEIREVVG